MGGSKISFWMLCSICLTLQGLTHTWLKLSSFGHAYYVKVCLIHMYLSYIQVGDWALISVSVFESVTIILSLSLELVSPFWL